MRTTPSAASRWCAALSLSLSLAFLARYPVSFSVVAETHRRWCGMCGHIRQFCFPDGIMMKYEEDPVKFHTFVLTGLLGGRLYGFCLVFPERHLLPAAPRTSPLSVALLFATSVGCSGRGRTHATMCHSSWTAAAWTQALAKVWLRFQVPVHRLPENLHEHFQALSRIVRGLHNPLLVVLVSFSVPSLCTDS
jgi:hypothetical protein